MNFKNAQVGDKVWSVLSGWGKKKVGGTQADRLAGQSADAIVAHSNHEGLQGEQKQGSNEKARKKPHDKQLAGCSGTSEFRPIPIPTEPKVRRRNDGLPKGVARLKALGNAVVPQIPEMIGRAIMNIDN